MSNQHIEVGDRVDVFWENIGYLFDVKVVSMPNSPGDYWTFESEDGRIHCVQNFARISHRVKP